MADTHYDDLTVLKKKTQTASKDKECSHCGKLIFAGEEYDYVVSVQHGDFKTEHFHITNYFDGSCLLSSKEG